MISEGFAKKRNAVCISRMNGFSRIQGREEKSNLAPQKTAGISVGFLYISKWFLCWMFEIILALY